MERNKNQVKEIRLTNFRSALFNPYECMMYLYFDTRTQRREGDTLSLAEHINQFL